MSVTSEGVKRRGFASMTPERKKEVAQLGGRAARRMGRGHSWKPGAKETKDAARLGGLKSRRGPSKRKQEVL